MQHKNLPLCKKVNYILIVSICAMKLYNSNGHHTKVWLHELSWAKYMAVSFIIALYTRMIPSDIVIVVWL